MLHILLLILKIIGIVLAALLGVAVLVLLCVLFVPVRYRIEAEGKPGGEQPVHAGIKVSWLLHIITIGFAYPEAACIRVKVFCFTLFDSSRKKKAEETEKGSGRIRKRKKTEKEKKKRLSEEEDAETAEGPEEENTKKDERIITGPGPVSEDAEHENAPEEGEGTGDGDTMKTEAVRGENAEEEEQVEETDSEKGLKGFPAKAKAFCLALKQCLLQFIAALKNIEYTIGKICDKIKEIIENIRYYTEVLKSKTFRSAWAVSKKQLLRILRMLKPRVCRVNVLAGTGDPAGTGQLLAFYGMLYPWIGNCVSVEADFENKVMEGSLFIKGRVRVIVFLLAAFQLFINKNIRRLLKMLKRSG